MHEIKEDKQNQMQRDDKNKEDRKKDKGEDKSKPEEKEELFDFEGILSLAQIDIPLDKKEEFRKQVEEIVRFFGTINELDLEGVEPTAWKFEESQRLRDDTPKKFENIKGIIDGFPKRRERFAVVPQVISEKIEISEEEEKNKK